MPHLFKCVKCGEYTLSSQTCPKCGAAVVSPSPQRYSPQDKYGEYRRKAKKLSRAAQ